MGICVVEMNFKEQKFRCFSAFVSIFEIIKSILFCWNLKFRILENKRAHLISENKLLVLGNISKVTVLIINIILL